MSFNWALDSEAGKRGNGETVMWKIVGSFDKKWRFFRLLNSPKVIDLLEKKAPAGTLTRKNKVVDTKMIEQLHRFF